MAKCVQCGTTIKDDAKYCPVCGLRNPLEKKTSDDFTVSLDDINDGSLKMESKSKTKACFLAMSIGFLGAQYRYLENKKMSIIIIILSILTFIAGGVLSYLFISKNVFISLLIGFLLMYLLNIVDGFTFLLFKRKDGRGVELE